jgi:hypothetical protein
MVFLYKSNHVNQSGESTMNKNSGKAGVRVGWILLILGLLVMATPWVFSLEMMHYGFGIMALGLFVAIAGLITLLILGRQRKVIKEMADGEVLVRWTYDKTEWRKRQAQEVREMKSMPVFGAVLGGIFVVIGLVFYLSNPDDMELMLVIMAAIGVLIALFAWLSTTLRIRAVLRDPGEAVISRKGVFFLGALTDWNGVTSIFDIAQVEEKNGHTSFFIKYRYLHGRYGRMVDGSLAVPVPPGHEDEAVALARELNAGH